jgi:gluconokinase
MRLVLDRLDGVEPVTSVRATGGAFRSSLWREVMSAVLGRPLAVVDGDDGTARGAAALALFALGRAATLADAAGQLRVGGAVLPPVEVDPGLTATYDRLRASVPGLIGRLAPVAGLFARPATVERPPPPTASG